MKNEIHRSSITRSMYKITEHYKTIKLITMHN